MKIKLWDPFPVCPPELAKELFPPLRKGWKRAKKKLYFQDIRSLSPAKKSKDLARGRFCRSVWGLSQAQDAGQQVREAEHSGDCGFVPLCLDEKPLFGQQRVTLSVCWALQHQPLVVISLLRISSCQGLFVGLSKGAQWPLCSGSLSLLVPLESQPLLDMLSLPK